MKTHYRAIWISDTHLCSRDSRMNDLLGFLKNNKSDYLYLVGDILDIWQLKRRWYWPGDVNAILNKIIKRANKGTKVIFIPGNHDECFREYAGYKLGGVEVAQRAVHITIGGKRLLVLHGDDFDMVVQHHKWLAVLGSAAYDYLIWLNKILNAARGLFGLRYWSLSAAVKVRVKQAVLFMSNFEDAAIHEARRAGMDGIVCGHIHHPDCKEIGGIKYFNCGDWVENCSAIIETESGEMRVLNWAEEGANIPDAQDDEDHLVIGSQNPGVPPFSIEP